MIPPERVLEPLINRYITVKFLKETPHTVSPGDSKQDPGSIQFIAVVGRDSLRDDFNSVKAKIPNEFQRYTDYHIKVKKWTLHLVPELLLEVEEYQGYRIPSAAPLKLVPVERSLRALLRRARNLLELEARLATPRSAENAAKDGVLAALQEEGVPLKFPLWSLHYLSSVLLQS